MSALPIVVAVVALRLSNDGHNPGPMYFMLDLCGRLSLRNRRGSPYVDWIWMILYQCEIVGIP